MAEFKDSFVPIRFGLKYGNDKKTTLYVAVDQEEIKTEVIKAAETENPSPTTSNSVTYNISQIVPFVNNKDILRYLPDDMLNEAEANHTSFEQDVVRKIAKAPLHLVVLLCWCSR